MSAERVEAIDEQPIAAIIHRETSCTGPEANAAAKAIIAALVAAETDGGEVWKAEGPGRAPSYHRSEQAAKDSITYPANLSWHRYHEGHSSAADGYCKVTRLKIDGAAETDGLAERVAALADRAAQTGEGIWAQDLYALLAQPAPSEGRPVCDEPCPLSRSVCAQHGCDGTCEVER